LSKPTPLSGKVIAITRPANQSKESEDYIRQLGGSPYPIPMLEITPNKGPELEKFIAEICSGRFDQLIFLSVNSVESLFTLAEEMSQGKTLTESIRRLKILAIGRKTLDNLKERGISDAYMAENQSTEGVLEALGSDLRGMRIGVPRSNLANNELKEAVTQRGATVTEVTAYTTEAPKDTSNTAKFLDDLTAGKIHAVTFTSASTATNLMETARKLKRYDELKTGLTNVIVAAIGQRTASTLTDYRIAVDAVPDTASTKAMIDSIAAKLPSKVILDETDKALLTIIQDEVPLTSRPFDELGQKLGLPYTEVIRRIERLRSEGVIRRISPVLETDEVGLKARTLILMKVPPARVEEVGAIVSGFDTVTHNYERNSEYNLWFTLITSSNEELEKSLDEILEATGIPEDDVLNLPVTRRHKIKVSYNFR
jgi:uroporphyrinogen-III synthase/DNA-binding Lrp family transcriptional regulator